MNVDLSDREVELLRSLLREPSNTTARDVLAFAGVRTVAGLMAKLVAGDVQERAILLTAIRRMIANVPSESQV